MVSKLVVRVMIKRVARVVWGFDLLLKLFLMLLCQPVQLLLHLLILHDRLRLLRLLLMAAA